ncbi:hypothetical protein V5799_011206 [Amblyomma americanum]|uniref:THAP-type domain-containing protein n=1 Tax=Amblyomma americanum TaxID=6943 RepID=A0AAQ4EHV8_AMBAM
MSSIGETIHFYRFPARPYNLERRKAWICAVRKHRGEDAWEPAQSSHICSHHFAGNRKSEDPRAPNYNPTVFPQGQRKRPSTSQPQGSHRSKERRTCAFKLHSTRGSHDEDDSEPSPSPGCRTGEEVHNKVHQVKTREVGTMTSCEVREVATMTPFDEVRSERRKVKTRQIGTLTLCSPGERLSRPCSFSSFTDGTSASTQTSSKYISEQSIQTEAAIKRSVTVGPDHKLVFFAGAQTVQGDSVAMQSLCAATYAVFTLLMSIIPDTRTTYELSKADRLALFLMKLKTGLTYSALGALFGIHRTTAARCFLSVLNTLYVKTQDWIQWYQDSEVLATTPDYFKVHYPECEVVVDCEEVRVERPAPVEIRNLYSNSKGTFSAKFLFGIAPNGALMFLKAYEGGTIDGSTGTNMHVASMLETGYIVAEPSGHSARADFAQTSAILIRAPAPNGESSNDEEVPEIISVASVRNHVERMILRLKVFNILNLQPTSDLHDHIEQIVHVICILTNLQSSISKNSE